MMKPTEMSASVSITFGVALSFALILVGARMVGALIVIVESHESTLRVALLHFTGALASFFTAVSFIAFVMNGMQTGTLSNFWMVVYPLSFILAVTLYNIWLLLRDRALQNPFFHTPIWIVRVAQVWIASSVLYELVLFIILEGQTEPIMFGTMYLLLVDVMYTCFMCWSFNRGLNTHGSIAGVTPSAVVLDVMKRTQFGAYVHIAGYVFAWAIMLIGGVHGMCMQSLSCTLMFAFMVFPIPAHISLSHRDDISLGLNKVKCFLRTALFDSLSTSKAFSPQERVANQCTCGLLKSFAQVDSEESSELNRLRSTYYDDGSAASEDISGSKVETELDGTKNFLRHASPSI